MPLYYVIIQHFFDVYRLFMCASSTWSVISNPQCKRVCRMTGLMEASSARVFAADILLHSCDLNRPLGPALFSQRDICRASSPLRRPLKNRQYLELGNLKAILSGHIII